MEQWFDDVNPFDDEAEAREPLVRLLKALTQIGIPAVQGYKIGASLNFQKHYKLKKLVST